MPTRDARAGQAETQTPKPPDGDEREESPPQIQPKRVTRPPNNYTRKQEEESTRYTLDDQTKHQERDRPKTRNETTAEHTNNSKNKTETGNSNPQTTELLKELVKLQREIKRRDKTHREELRKAKTQFADALARIQQKLAELRDELTTFQINYNKTLRVIQSLRISITTPDSTNNLFYADIARTPPTSQPSNIQTLSSFNTTSTTFTDTLYCTIDTSNMINNRNERRSTDPIRAAVEKEIQTIENHTNWRCRAVTVNPKNTNQIQITCRDKAKHQLIKKITKATIGTGARVLRDDLYPIKVDSVRKAAVLDKNNKIQIEAAAAFSEENKTTVTKITWLSRKENGKAYKSMVVYLTKNTDTRRLLAEKFFHAERESGVISAFKHRPRPTQYYNCQEIEHKTFQCNNIQKCTKYAKEDHRHNIYNKTIPKCVPCEGPYKSYSRNC